MRPRYAPAPAATRSGRTGAMTWEELSSASGRATRTGSRGRRPEQLVRVGNAAYGAGLSLLMLGRRSEAAEWLDRAAARWRESWEHATPTSWGRPIGTIKAALIAGHDEAADGYAAWALGLGPAEAGVADRPLRGARWRCSRSAAGLPRRSLAASLQGRGDFPPAVADALAADRRRRRDGVRRARSRRSSPRSRRARTTSRTSRSPTPCSCSSGWRPAAASLLASAARRSCRPLSYRPGSPAAAAASR